MLYPVYSQIPLCQFSNFRPLLLLEESLDPVLTTQHGTHRARHLCAHRHAGLYGELAVSSGQVVKNRYEGRWQHLD
jgi:hypothetical protein